MLPNESGSDPDGETRSRLQRRQFLGGAVVGGTVVTAGCLGIFDGCRSDDTIGDKSSNPEAYYTGDGEQLMGVVGEVDSVDADRVILDDGTGTAAITSGPVADWQTSSADFDCARGSGSYLEEMQGEYDADVVLFDGQVRQHDP